MHSNLAGRKNVIAGFGNGMVRAWDVESHVATFWRFIHKGAVSCVAVNNQYIFSGGDDETIQITNILTGLAATPSGK